MPAWLSSHLLEQLHRSALSAEQRTVGELIIRGIDRYGYLSATIPELSNHAGVAPEFILSVLRIIQTFHPAGVGARDLRECLMLQLERLDRENTVEYRLVRDCMRALGRRQFVEMAQVLGVDVADVQKATQAISQLEPRPGRNFLSENPDPATN